LAGELRARCEALEGDLRKQAAVQKEEVAAAQSALRAEAVSKTVILLN
jgi:hypothetical protein